MLIDTHAHLDESTFDVDRDDVLGRARDAGLVGVLSVGITAQTSRAAVDLAEQYGDVWAVVGIQPNYVSQVAPGDWELIERLAEHPRVVAVGETGLDRYWDHSPSELQAEYFSRHLELSRAIGKPFVVHCREAEAEVVAQLQESARRGPLRGVMHSFCGDHETASACLELGLHLSFAGMLTYRKNDMLRAVAARVPPSRLLVETDAPYLVPHQARESKKRGGLGMSRNEPAFVRFTAECLAEQVGLSREAVERVTTANARELFGLPVGDAS
jgi:TatD DNase family protein